MYVCTDALPRFAAEIVPRLTDPFVLVSGDSDRAVDLSLAATPAISALLSSDLLLGWYAQNRVLEHPKLRSLPIGLDYHTMWEQPGRWGLTALSALAQERLLLDTLARAPSLPRRYLSIYNNWHFAIERGDRRACRARLDPALCFYEPHPISRAASWSRAAEFLFVACPEGEGMDCHRTWETLLLGSIPIVKRNALLPLFDGLPVLVVDDWDAISRDQLERFVQKVLKTTYDFSGLFLQTWIDRWRGRRPQPVPRATFETFRQWLTRTTG